MYCAFQTKGVLYMDPVVARRLIEVYRRMFMERGIGKQLYRTDIAVHVPVNSQGFLEQCRGLLDHAESLVNQGKMGKATRWIGIAQGMLISAGVYNLNDIERHITEAGGV